MDELVSFYKENANILQAAFKEMGFSVSVCVYMCECVYARVCVYVITCAYMNA